MPVSDIEHIKIAPQNPSQLLSLTKVCVVNWNDYCRRMQNGLTQQQQEQLLSEFYSMKAVIRHLIPEEPVRVEDNAIVYEPSKMEGNKIYSVELRGILHLVRKIDENTVETYELEPIE